jgi:hypothetical protein
LNPIFFSEVDYPQFSKKKSLTFMELKVNFKDYSGAAKIERHNPTEPNQALQRKDVLKR